MTLNEKDLALREALVRYGSTLVAFSGGVDSSFLLARAKYELGTNAAAALVVSPLLTRDALDDARATARRLGAELHEIRLNELEDERIRANQSRRCYFCKLGKYRELVALARREKFAVVLDGSNADDDLDYRPGAKAVSETGARTPLRDAGFTKAEIREAAKRDGLPFWNKPADSCLATRVPYGEPLEESALRQIERAEREIKALGFSAVRARRFGDRARVELPAEELERGRELADEIQRRLRAVGFQSAAVAPYRRGALNNEIDATRQPR
ncbi:MAG: ATP-dependent sacrificial sulfur transferase LarE [Ignavibacteriales bacterium]|nr:ATP-dependent sacrificial sulfur transferase LarE [Ignavibacteriales bacterium]